MIKVLRDWPYWPPEEYDFTPLSEHWRPAGYLLLSEVVDIVGSATFGDEWTGQELKARELPFSQEKIISPVEAGVRHYPSPPPSRGDDSWRVFTTQGDQFIKSKEAAFELWESEKPQLLEMWQKEDAAWGRHDVIVRKLRTDLNAGTLNAWAHQPDTGKLIEIPTHVWARDDISSVFELGNDRTKWQNPNIISFNDCVIKSVTGRVLLKQSDVEDYVAPAADITSTPGRSGNENKYTTAYLDLQRYVAQILGLKEGIRTPKDDIKHCLRENWSKFIEGPVSDRMVEQMATTLRSPKDQHGGLFTPDRDT